MKVREKFKSSKMEANDQTEMVVDPNEVFPELGENLPVPVEVETRDGSVANTERRRETTPDPVSDAGGEGSHGVGNRPTHSEGEESDATTARYGSIIDELPDPPLDELVQDDQTYQRALKQTALSDNNNLSVLSGSSRSKMADNDGRVTVTPQVCGVMTPLSCDADADSDSSSSSSEEEKKKRKKKKIRKRHHSSDSDDSTSSRRHKKKRAKKNKKAHEQSRFFKIVSKKDLNKYDLPKDMAELVNRQCRIFVKDKDQQEQILDYHPVPTNIREPPTLDKVTENSLTLAKKERFVKKDNNIRRAQTKIYEAMGPLARIWAMMEQLQEDQNISALLDTSSVSRCLEQGLTMLGQAQVSLLYTRRCDILEGLGNSHSQAKELLKSNETLLSEDKGSDNELLGEEFRDHMKDLETDLRKAARVLKAHNNGGPPFPAGPSSARGGGQGKSGHGTFSNGAPQRRSIHNGQNANPANGHFGRGGTSSSTRGENSSRYFIPQAIWVLGTPSGQENSRLGQHRVPCGLKVEILFQTVEENYVRSRHFRNGGRLGNKLSHQAATFRSETNKHVGGGAGGCRSGNRVHAKKRSHFRGKLRTRSSALGDFSKGQEGRLVQTHSEPKMSEQSYSLRSLQNGVLEKRKRHAKTRGSHGKNRPQRRILYPPSAPQIQEICKVSMGKENLSVPLPVLRARPSTKIVHQTNEGPDNSAEEAQNQTDYLPRRYPNNGVVRRGNFDGQGYGDLRTSGLGLCDKLGKIRAGASSGNGIFGNNNKQRGDVHASDRGEDIQIVKVVQGHTEIRENHSEKNGELTGQTNCHSGSSDPVHVTGEIHATIAHTGSEGSENLVRPNLAGQESQSRTKMVDREPPAEGGETNSDSSPRLSNSLRCSQNRGLGCRVQGSPNRGAMVQNGGQAPHKRDGNDCSRASNKNVSEDVSQNPQYSVENRQHVSPELHRQNGGHRECGTDRGGQKNMGFLASFGDHTYSRVHPNKTKCGCRLPVQECGRQQRMETKSRDFQGGSPKDGETSGRSVRFTNLTSTKSVHESKSRSKLLGCRCPPAGLGSSLSIRFPSIQSHREGIEEGSGSEDQYDFNRTIMGVPALVPLAARNGDTGANLSTMGGGCLAKPTGGKASSGFKWISASDSMAGVRAGPESSKFPENVKTLISSSRSAGTRYNYNTSWKKFCGWCDRRKVNPVQSPVGLVLEFLAELFDKGLMYRTINNYRSAISARHELVGGVPLGEHRDVCRLMKGINNERPPQPRYCSTWDVVRVLEFIKSLGENQALSDKNITLKLSVLLAITSAHRGAELKQLKVSLMNLHDEFVDFTFSGKLKTSKQGKNDLSSKFHQFTEDQRVCPVLCLREYLDRSRNWRYQEGSLLLEQLFLSHIKPHKVVSKPTIARWIKEFLGMAGIDIGVYKAHSTRAAATSKADSLGLRIEDIVGQGNWSNKTTFERFYRRPIDPRGKAFQHSILGAK